MTQLSLDTWGGLVASTDPSNIPEGASPRTYDTDFVTGGWQQRPGLNNVYMFQGQFTGPNPGFHAVDTPIYGGVWQNPSNILLNDGNYASCVLPVNVTVTLDVQSVQTIKSGLIVVNLYVTFNETPPASIIGSQV